MNCEFCNEQITEITEFDYSKLKGRIVEKYGNHTNFADVLGTTKQTENAKVNNKSSFGQVEIKKWCKLLEIPDEEIHLYFFSLPKSSMNGTSSKNAEE